MANPNSIDELFLKALDLNGPKRRAFLRTLPAQTRAQISVLLAADESVAKKEFLEDGFNETDPKKNRKASGQRLVASPTPRQKPSSDRGEAKKAPRSRKSEAATPRPVASRRGERSERKRRSGRKKQTKRPRSARPTGPLLVGVAAVLMCSTLVWLIVDTLRQPETVDATVADVQPTPMQPMPPSEEVVVSTPEKILDPTPTTNASETSGLPLFYTPAVSAPPLTTQQLKILSKALHDASPVANPLPLPGVRAWSLETKGYRAWSAGTDLSADGQLAAVGSGDGSIRIVDVHTGHFLKLITVLDTNSFQGVGSVRKVKWSPDSEELFAGNVNHIFKIDVDTGISRAKVGAIRGQLQFNQDFSSLYAVRNGRLSVLSPVDFAIQEELETERDGELADVSLSFNDKYLLLSGGKRIGLYENTRPLKLVLEDSRPIRPRRSVVRGDGTAVTSWQDGTIRLYSAKTPGEGVLAEYEAYPTGPKTANCCAFKNDDIVLCTGWSNSLDEFSISKRQFVKRHAVSRVGPPATYRPELESGLVAGGELRYVVDGVPKQTLVEGDVSLMGNLAFAPEGNEILVTGFQSGRFDLKTGQKANLTRTKARLHRFNTIDLDNKGRIVGCDDARVQVFFTHPPTADSSTSFSFSGGVVKALWTEDGRSILVQTKDGEVHYCRFDIENAQPIPIQVASGERVVDFVWNSVEDVGLLLMESQLVEWNPVTEAVTEICEIPKRCRALTLNAAGTFLAIAAPKTILLETVGYSTVAEFDWKNAKPFWAADDELIGISDRGRTMYKVNAAVPENVNRLSIPLAGFGNRGAISISPTAPVAAAITPGNQIRFIDIRNGAHLGTLLPFGDDHVLLTPEGRIVGMSPGMQDQIIYQILTDEGQETLTSAEFRRRYGKYLTP